MAEEVHPDPLERAYRARGSAFATLWDALASERSDAVDAAGLAGLLANAPRRVGEGDPYEERTAFARVRVRCGAAALGYAGDRAGACDEAALDALEEALTEALRAALEGPEPVALALSGGLDAALLLALARRAGLAFSAVYTLAPAWPSYSEAPRTRAIAAALGAPLRSVGLTEAGFVGAARDAVRAAAEPLYNLHPVGRVVLARALRDAGLGAVVTGDGADQVFAGRAGRDWLPLVAPLARAGGVTLRAPFLDARVRRCAALAGLARGPDKPALRALAARHLPAWVSEAPKRTALAPYVSLAGLLAERDATRCAAALAALPAEARAATGELDAHARATQRETLALLLRGARYATGA